MVSIRHRPSVSRSDQYAAICAALWAERDLLQTLVGSIVDDRLASADPASAAAGALDRLALQEVLRAAVVEFLVTSVGARPGATLGELVRGAPEPWASILIDHGAALRSLLVDVAALGDVRQPSLADFLGSAHDGADGAAAGQSRPA